MLYRVIIHTASGITVAALELPQGSGHEIVSENGHMIAAAKGHPFECNSLSLPLFVVSGTPPYAPC